jgi:hypothetical protein
MAQVHCFTTMLTNSHDPHCWSAHAAVQVLQQQQLSDSQTHSAAMHLGGRLSGRVVTRSKARAGDGFGSDTEHISAVLQQPAADATASKGDYTRKPTPQVPGQISVPVVASARLSHASGTAAPAAAPAPVAASATKPRHQRSSSAGHAPKGFLHVQSDVASDLAYIADTLIKACDDTQPDDTQPAQPLPGPAGGLARRSARLAAPAADSAAAAPTSKALSRASAPVRQHKRLPSASLAAHCSFPRQKASAAAAAAGASPVAAAPAAADSSAQPSSSATTSEGATPGSARRVRFAAGPLDPEQHPNATEDGHPASEGALAVPVRRMPNSYAMDLSKGSVLMLQDLLGPDCIMSVTR